MIQDDWSSHAEAERMDDKGIVEVVSGKLSVPLEVGGGDTKLVLTDSTCPRAASKACIRCF